MKPLWRGKKKRAGQGKFWVAMGFIRNHPIHTLERHVSVSANLLSLISGISHIPHSLQRFSIAIESIPTIMKRWKLYNGGHVCTLSPPQPQRPREPFKHFILLKESLMFTAEWKNYRGVEKRIQAAIEIIRNYMFSHSRNTPYGAPTHVVSRLRVHLKYLLTTFIVLPHLSSR